MNGAEATGGALYFIALMPYAVLAIFLGIGLSSDGGIDGLVRLFQVENRTLLNILDNNVNSLIGQLYRIRNYG